jgi:hypothetical protein
MPPGGPGLFSLYRHYSSFIHAQHYNAINFLLSYYTTLTLSDISVFYLPITLSTCTFHPLTCFSLVSSPRILFVYFLHLTKQSQEECPLQATQEECHLEECPPEEWEDQEWEVQEWEVQEWEVQEWEVQEWEAQEWEAQEWEAQEWEVQWEVQEWADQE